MQNEITPEMQLIFQELAEMYKQRSEEQGLYTIADYETYTPIEYAITLDHAKQLVQAFEETDKREGTYTPNFYAIIDQNRNLIN